jgi:hypothetical protein
MDSGGQFLPSYQTVVERDLNEQNSEANDRS